MRPLDGFVGRHVTGRRLRRARSRSHDAEPRAPAPSVVIATLGGIDVLASWEADPTKQTVVDFVTAVADTGPVAGLAGR